MTTTRVATFASNNMYTSNMLRNQSLLNMYQTQVNTGMKSQDYTGLGDSSFRLVNLETQLSETQHYQDANKAVDLRMQVMQTAMGSLQSTAKNFLNKLTDYQQTAAGGQEMNPSLDQIPDQAETDDIQRWAWDALQQMKDYLNTQADGQYVFAGAKTQTKPVELLDPSRMNGSQYATFDTLEQFQDYYTGLDPAITGNATDHQYPTTRNTVLTATTDAFGNPTHIPYYKGDNQSLSYRVDRDRELQVGINASDPAFEKAMRAMAMIAQGPSDTVNGTHGSTGNGVDVTAMSTADRQSWADNVAQAMWLLGDSLNADTMKRSTTVSPYATNNPPESASDFSSIQRITGDNQNVLASITTTQTSYISFLNAQTDNIEKADPAQAIVNMQAAQRALEASYSTISMVKDLSLVKYMS